ncbi:unnamed protein product, partial [Allacma fusca]
RSKDAKKKCSNNLKMSWINEVWSTWEH